MADSNNSQIDRRRFLKGTLTGAAAVAAGARTASSQTTEQARRSSAPVTGPDQLAREAGTARPPAVQRAAVAPGSDLMVEVLRDLGIEYISSNPGSSFEGLQESIVNYGNPPNRMPEFITALHEMSAVDMASGYARAEGRPMAALLHGTLGIQNASMAIFQAFSGRIPMLLLVGRDNGFIQAHTADDMAAMTPPCGPALVVLDTEVQKEEAPGKRAPVAPALSIGGLEGTTARAIAEGLVAADNPRIAVGQLRTPAGVKLAIELAELVGASVSTSATQGPMSFPQRHPLVGPGADTRYDYTLGLEAAGAQASLRGPALSDLAFRDEMQIGFGHLRRGSTVRGRIGGSPPGGENDIAVDAEASLPAIIEAARRALTNGRRRSIERRTEDHARANRTARLAALRDAVEAKRIGWDASPVSTARLYAELWPLIKDDDWCLASPTNFSGGHHRDLWDHDKPYSYLGGQPAGGMGYGLGQSVGAALAAKERGRIVINIQQDGDLNYGPGSLWTAVHHRLPILTIIINADAEQVADLYAYIMTLEENAPPLEEIPALNAILEAAEADDGG